MEQHHDEEPPAKVPSDISSQEPWEEVEEPSMQAESRHQSPLLEDIGGQQPELEEPSMKLRYTLDDDCTEGSDKRVLTQQGLENQLIMKRKTLKQAIKGMAKESGLGARYADRNGQD